MGLWNQLQPGETKPLSETRRQIFEKVRRKMVELGLENPFCPSSLDQLHLEPIRRNNLSPEICEK